MKKILHITECLGSGVLFYVKNMCKWQIHDYEVVVAYATRPETPADFEKQFDPKVKLIKVNNFTREITPSKDLRAFFEVRKIVKDEKPDLIHLHSTKAGVIGRWAINCNKYRVLYSPHAYSFLMQDCSNWKRTLYKKIEKMSAKKGGITVADIEGEYEESKAITDNSVCIHNGIDCDEMDALIQEAVTLLGKEQPSDFKKITICTLGKVVPQKNPALFNNIAKELPGVDFLWIGSGPLEHLLDSPNITVSGWIPRKEAISKVMRSDIFLFPSAWESLSIALVEAMYIGKTCIVSGADGNRDIIKDNHTGFVCYSLEEYVKALKYLVNEPDKIREMGNKARQTVVEKYNTSEMERRYKELFKTIGIG